MLATCMRITNNVGGCYCILIVLIYRMIKDVTASRCHICEFRRDATASQLILSEACTTARLTYRICK